MSAARNLVLAVLLVPLIACGGSAAPSGPLVDVANRASSAQRTDVAFDTFVAQLGLPPDVVEQLKASRAAVNAKFTPPKLITLAARLGLMISSADDVITPLMFARTLADALDPLTAGKYSGGQTKSDPLTSTTDGPTTSTTTFLNMTIGLSAAGSRVTLTMHWTYREKTVDKASGQTTVDISDDRTMVGGIDVCPNSSGISGSTLDVHIEMSATHGGTNSTRSSTSSNTLSGHVDDQAVLRHVVQDSQQQASWHTSSASGGYELNGTGYDWSAGSSGVGGGLNAGGVSGTLNGTGGATAEQIRREAGATLAIDLAAVQDAYKEAQRLWRAGRCVVIQAPDYSAETPVSTNDQEKIQNDKEVDTDSKTKFAVNLKHRFGGGLAQPVKAALGGDKKLDPTELKSGAGAITYTAPAEDDKQATVTLKSVSKRGIGTLVIAFHTKGKHLKLSVKGTATVVPQGAPILTLQWSISIGPADFHKVGENKWEATAPSKGQGAYVKLALPNCKIAFTEEGTVTLVATKDIRGDKSVWVVRMDQERSTATLSAASCVGGATNQVPTGGYSVQALNDVGEVVIPADGGTVTQTGSHPIPGTTGSSTLTFTATVSVE